MYRSVTGHNTQTGSVHLVLSFDSGQACDDNTSGTQKCLSPDASCNSQGWRTEQHRHSQRGLPTLELTESTMILSPTSKGCTTNKYMIDSYTVLTELPNTKAKASTIELNMTHVFCRSTCKPQADAEATLCRA